MFYQNLVHDIIKVHDTVYTNLNNLHAQWYENLSGINDSKERLGGTISSSLFAIMQGVQILRVHDVNEINQSIKVFNSLKF